MFANFWRKSIDENVNLQIKTSVVLIRYLICECFKRSRLRVRLGLRIGLRVGLRVGLIIGKGYKIDEDKTI